MLYPCPDLRDNEIRLILLKTCEAIPEKGYVPAYKFSIALSDGTGIGICDLRVGHNRNTYYGGNIGYAIDKPCRGHRYGAKAVKLLLGLAALNDMNYVIITCDVENRASSRTCQIAGGMLIDVTDVPKDSELCSKGIHRIRVYKFLVSTMRTVMDLDMKDYDPTGPIYNRHSVRGIIIKDRRIAMVHALRHGYYKFPGGGTEGIETQADTLSREVREESGLIVIPKTIRPFGLVHRVQRNRRNYMYTQDNYYYLCDVEDRVQSQQLDANEARDGFVLEFVDPEVAIKASRKTRVDHFIASTIKRETGIIELLIKEGYFRQDARSSGSDLPELIR